MLAGRRGVTLFEAGEEALGVGLVEAGAGVGDLEAPAAAAFLEHRRHGDLDAALLGELDGVAEQVDQDLAHPLGVAQDLARDAIGQTQAKAEAARARLRAEGLNGIRSQGGQVEGRGGDRHGARAQAVEVQQVADQPVEGAGRGQDVVYQPALVGVQRRAAQHVGQAHDAVQRRAQFVADVGQELALGLAGRLGARQGFGQGNGLGLHGGDVDAQADDAAVAGAALLDHHPAAVRQPLFVALAGVAQHLQPPAQPFILVTDGFGIVAPRHPDPQGVLQPRAGGEKVGGAMVDLGVALVPEDVAALGVEEDDALGQGVQGGRQALLGQARVGLGAGDGAARQQRLGHGGRQAAREAPLWPIPQP